MEECSDAGCKAQKADVLLIRIVYGSDTDNQQLGELILTTKARNFIQKFVTLSKIFLLRPC